MTATPASVLSPGHLKLDLAVRGVRLDETLRAWTEELRAAPAAADAAGGIEIILPEEVWVSAPIDAQSPSTTPYLLSGSGDEVVLQQNGDRISVRVVRQPDFYRLTTSAGTPMWQVGAIRGGFIAINQGAACGYGFRGAPCRFCRSGTGIAIEDGFPMSVAEVVEVVRAAFAEGAAEFVYFNPPYVGSEDAGIVFLEPYIRAVKKHFDTLVAVQIHPPKSDRWIDHTYAMGVDAVSYGVEIHDYELLARRCAGRVRHIGRERYYEALAYAASVFPSGTVWSDLVLGLEPAESTLRGVETLVSAGVLPVLSMPRPEGGAAAINPEAAQPILTTLFQTVRQAKINMGWVRDLSFAITPLEARFFAGDEARVSVAMQHFYRSKLGTLTARSLSGLRRRLRVRTIGDSFDAARL
jgi:hypothetical protein